MRDARANVTVHRLTGSRVLRLRDRALVAAGLLLGLLLLGVQLARAGEVVPRAEPSTQFDSDCRTTT